MNTPTDADRSTILAEIRERLKDLSEFFEHADAADDVPQDYPQIESMAGRLTELTDEIHITGMASGSEDNAQGDCNPELGAELLWNSRADQYNQWDALGQDEKDELIAEFIAANGKHVTVF